MACLTFTELQGDLKSALDRQLHDIEQAVELVSEKRAATWDSLLTSREIPVPKLQPDATDTQHRYARTAVLAKNRSAAEHSDCLIAHAWDNGSAMLGDIQRSFLAGPLVRPVVVVRHVGNPKMSLAWEAFADEHPTFIIVDFDADLLERLKDVLEHCATTIEQSAVERQRLEERMRPICDALQRAVAAEHPTDRADFARSIGLTDAAFFTLVSRPVELAALASHSADALRARYNHVIRRTIVGETVSFYFAKSELRAFKEWSTRQPQERTTLVLEAEIKLRESAGVFAPRPQRNTMDAWDILAAELHV